MPCGPLGAVNTANHPPSSLKFSLCWTSESLLSCFASSHTVTPCSLLVLLHFPSLSTLSGPGTQPCCFPFLSILVPKMARAQPMPFNPHSLMPSTLIPLSWILTCSPVPPGQLPPYLAASQASCIWCYPCFTVPNCLSRATLGTFQRFIPQAWVSIPALPDYFT